MDEKLSGKLFNEGLISEKTYRQQSASPSQPLFSLHWELKTLLYIGVALLSTGLGILIYKNTDTIGHQAILLFIASISAGSFYWSVRHKKPFSRERVTSSGALFDYVLLLGCLTLLSFLAYLQFQYSFFGTHYGLAVFIPMIILFYVAYEFDHMGILSLAITNLGLWLGLTINPVYLIEGHLGDYSLLNTYLFLGILLLVAAWLSERYNFKKHFRFSYLHFGLNITFITLLAGYFTAYDKPWSLLWIAGTFGVGYVLYKDAFRHKSFFFLLLIILYLYIAASALVVRCLILAGEVSLMLGLLYFIVSASALIKLLIFIHKKLKA